MLVELDGTVEQWLEPDPVRALRSLRDDLTQARASEALFVLGADAIERDLSALGMVVGPSLRCAPDEVAKLAGDAWAWLTEGAAASVEPVSFAAASDALARRA